MLKAQKLSFLYSLKSIIHEDDERQDDFGFQSRKNTRRSQEKETAGSIPI